ncbi:hypothetical protein UlMin_027788 [Ulmus minor]
MSGLNFNEQQGILGSVSDAPPTHYTLKIQSFSLLTKNTIDKYESAAFEAGGYEWKLVIYPNGNKSKNVKENISVNLAMAESLQIGWEVHAVLRLFLLDQNNDNYMVLQDAVGKERRFHKLKLEWGFDEFIPLKTFNDGANGFLVDDTCVFGAEVFVCKERSRENGECLRMIKDPILNKHTWRVDNFSKLSTEYIESKIFNAGGHKWKVKLYPNGEGGGLGTHLSLHLALESPLPTSKIYAEFTLRILNQLNVNHHYGKATNWFSASNEDQQHGWSRFITAGFFSLPNWGFLVKDTCIIEAEVTVHGVSNPL